jgi:hypothetical protein
MKLGDSLFGRTVCRINNGDPTLSFGEQLRFGLAFLGQMVSVHSILVLGILGPAILEPCQQRERTVRWGKG